MCYYQEGIPLLDTSVMVRGVARNASGNQLFPVGHISLDVENPEVKKLGLELDLPPTDCYWLKTFYVSSALRNQGIGRAAMDIVEIMATEPPLNAKTLALDTVHKEDQRTQVQPGDWSGMPKVSILYVWNYTSSVLAKTWLTNETYRQMTNQEWYTRRGYFLIKTVPNFYVSPDPQGTTRDLRTVFMRRDIV